MALTVFDTKGIAAESESRPLSRPAANTCLRHTKRIAADPSAGGVRGLITGPSGFQRQVTFALDEAPELITQRVKETLDD